LGRADPPAPRLGLRPLQPQALVGLAACPQVFHKPVQLPHGGVLVQGGGAGAAVLGRHLGGGFPGRWGLC
jgi:hypothetical protein